MLTSGIRKKMAMSIFSGVLISLSIAFTQGAHAKENDTTPQKITVANEASITKEWSDFFDESLYDLQEEIEISKEENKKALLIMFEMDECPFCARMKKTVINQSKVQDYFRKNFRIISIDIEGDLELTDFDGKETTQKKFSLKQQRVRATPVFQFIDLNGKTIKNGRLTGATRDADEFLLLGKFIVEGHNKDMPFTRYKRSQKLAR